MRPSAAERAWCSLPSRSSALSSSLTRRDPSTCSHPEVDVSTNLLQPSSPACGCVTPGPGPAAFSLLCGRYEGVDQRIADHLVDGELSVGDFVLAGGELAALVVVEATARLVPGVLGNAASTGDESFTTGLLEYPQYTRPAVFRGWEVPEVLRGGDHGRVGRWRRAAALWRTLERRPDLLDARGGLSADEVRLLLEHGYPLGAYGTGRAEWSDSESGKRQTAGDPSDRLEERDLS